MDNLRSVGNAIGKALPSRIRMSKELVNEVDLRGIDEINEARLLGIGGYNSVWLIKLHEPIKIAESEDPVGEFVIRLPCEDSLLPNQITNDVAFKTYVAANMPQIPVPRVYLYEATNNPDTSFTVEQYIDSPTLSSKWMTLTYSQKTSFSQKLASMFVDLLEVRSDMISGLHPAGLSPSPTVEGCKIFKGRHKFHRDECYPIGPYKSTKEYILSSYDREIHYYTHASDKDIDMDFFDEVTVPDWIETLKTTRESLAKSHIVDQPFVLTHGDFHAGNILVNGDQITGVIDWDFAGWYPLSEALIGPGIHVVSMTCPETVDEDFLWEDKIRELIRMETMERGWDPHHIDSLMGCGDWELGCARQEMVPY